MLSDREMRERLTTARDAAAVHGAIAVWSASASTA
jgi:hypothetical protein